VGTDLARRALARPDALTLTLAPRVARSLARFERATAFNQDLSGWVVNNVNGPYTCYNFCLDAGFNSTSRMPSFPGTCGNPGCSPPSPGSYYLASNGVTVKCPGVAVGGTFTLNGVTYTKRDRDGLRSIVRDAQLIDSKNKDVNQKLERSCTTGVTDMNGLFDNQAYTGNAMSKLNPAIDSWDTSSVTRMDRMWVLTAPAWVVGDVRPPALSRSRSRSRSLRASFARSLSRFKNSEFNKDINAWDTSSVVDMHNMWVLTSTRRAPARRARSLTLAPRVARSLARQVQQRPELQ
jgi:surface protein